MELYNCWYSREIQSTRFNTGCFRGRVIALQFMVSARADVQRLGFRGSTFFRVDMSTRPKLSPFSPPRYDDRGRRPLLLLAHIYLGMHTNMHVPSKTFSFSFPFFWYFKIIPSDSLNNDDLWSRNSPCPTLLPPPQPDPAQERKKEKEKKPMRLNLLEAYFPELIILGDTDARWFLRSSAAFCATNSRRRGLEFRHYGYAMRLKWRAFHQIQCPNSHELLINLTLCQERRIIYHVLSTRIVSNIQQKRDGSQICAL